MAPTDGWIIEFIIGPQTAVITETGLIGRRWHLSVPPTLLTRLNLSSLPTLLRSYRFSVRQAARHTVRGQSGRKEKRPFPTPTPLPPLQERD